MRRTRLSWLQCVEPCRDGGKHCVLRSSRSILTQPIMFLHVKLWEMEATEIFHLLGALGPSTARWVQTDEEPPPKGHQSKKAPTL